MDNRYAGLLPYRFISVDNRKRIEFLFVHTKKSRYWEIIRDKMNHEEFSCDASIRIFEEQTDVVLCGLTQSWNFEYLTAFCPDGEEIVSSVWSLRLDNLDPKILHAKSKTKLIDDYCYFGFRDAMEKICPSQKCIINYFMKKKEEDIKEWEYVLDTENVELWKEKNDVFLTPFDEMEVPFIGET